jgi:hypothetical protein
MDPVTTSGCVECANCGAVRPDELGTPPPDGVPPCPDCGSTGIILRIKASETIEVLPGGKLGLGVDHARGWQQVWRGLEGASILGTQSGTLDAANIGQAQRELETLFNECLNLRDHLANDSSVSVKKRVIYAAIDNDPALALAADLANTSKHAVLTKPLHSGHAPTIVKVTGVAAGEGAGWTLKMDISHDGNVLDGVTVATEAVSAWRSLLSSWGLAVPANHERFSARVSLG